MLIQCRECTGRVSTNARWCPHCGARHFRRPSWVKWLVIFVILATAYWWLPPAASFAYWGSKHVIAFAVNWWANGGPP